MGRPVLIGHSADGPVPLAVQVVTAYFGEQMGRRIRLVRTDSPAHCVQSIARGDYPMAFLPADTPLELPDEIMKLEGLFGDPGRSFVLVIGRDAGKKLEYSLIHSYLGKLAGSLTEEDWMKAADLVESGEGSRKVALELLRENDLL